MITESVASTPKSSRPKAVKISRVAAKREADVAKEKGFAGADATGREPTSLGARSWSRGFSFSVLTGGVVAGVLDGVTTGVTGSCSGCGFGAGSGSGSGFGVGAGGGASGKRAEESRRSVSIAALVVAKYSGEALVHEVGMEKVVPVAGAGDPCFDHPFGGREINRQVFP